MNVKKNKVKESKKKILLLTISFDDDDNVNMKLNVSNFDIFKAIGKENSLHHHLNTGVYNVYKVDLKIVQGIHLKL